MIERPYYWLDLPEGSWLRFNYATVASVRPCGGRFEVRIAHGSGPELRATRGTLARGKKDVEEWVKRARSTPGPCKGRR